MLTAYINAALKRAEYKRLPDGSWFAEIPGFEGIWANARTVEEARGEIQEVLEEWLILKLRDGDPLPVVDDIELRIVRKAVA